MKKAILGKKLGMTQIFTPDGLVIPVTVVEAGPCYVVQKKTNEKDMEEKVKTWAEEVSKIVVKTAKIISGKAPKDGNLNIVSAIVETYKKIVEDFKSKKSKKKLKT